MRHAIVAVTAMLLLTGAEEPLNSPRLTNELTTLLKQHNLDAFATPDPSEPGRFVGALFFQGEQLLVVGGHYPTPSAIQQRLAQKQFADAYRDLTVGCIPDGKLFFHDLGADGLHAGSRGSVDIMYEQVVNQTMFDGNWNKQKLTEKEYSQRLARADAAYSGLLTLLVNALRGMS